MPALRELLSDDFSFHGPMMATDGADSFVEQMQNFPFHAQYEASRMIVEGDNVAHMFDFVVSAPRRSLSLGEYLRSLPNRSSGRQAGLMQSIGKALYLLFVFVGI